MGIANSQIDRPDSDVKEQSPDLVIGKQETPEPLENFNGASQGFVFSSQAPSPAHHYPFFDNHPQENNPITKFERPSSSPDLTGKGNIKQESPSLRHPQSLQSPTNSHHRRPSQESAATEETTMSSLPKPPKSERRRNKKRSLSNQDSSIAQSAENADDKRSFIPQSSLDLDAPTNYMDTEDGAGPLGGDEQDEGESALNGASFSGDADGLDSKALRKQKRRERKRARKAEKIRLALLEANPEFGNHSDPTALAEARSLQQIASDALDDPSSSLHGLQDDTELPKSSKKRKHRTQAAAQPELNVPSDDHDVEVEDPNQLPTPDEEIQTTNNFGRSHDPDNAEDNQISNDTAYHQPEVAAISEIDEATTAATQSSSRKRKARDSDRKSRKKRKQLSEGNVNEFDMEDDDQVENTAIIAAHSQQAQASKEIGTKPTSQSSSLPMSVPKEAGGLGDFAQNLYAQRYNSQKSTPTKIATDKKLGKLKAQDDSPSAARLRRRSQDRSMSSRLPGDSEPINADEPAEQFEVEPDQEMDVDAEPEDDVEVDNDDISNLDSPYVDDEGSAGDQSDERDAEMDDVDPDDPTSQHKSNQEADVPMGNTDNEEVQPGSHGIEDRMQIGSDHIEALGGAETDEHTGEHAAEPSEEAAKAGTATDSLGHNQGTQKSSVSKRLRQYGSKASAGRKRVAKPSFLDREEEENVKAFAELPSPAAGAASRKNAKAAAASSSTTQDKDKGKGKQTKISAMMGGGSARPLSTPPSGRNPRKIKDPPPSEAISGAFTGFELRNIDVAIQRWRTDQDLTQAEVNDMIHLNPQKSNTSEFWDHVHAAVPRRKRQKIINQCRRKYHNFVARGAWTQEQHDELAQAYDKHGPKYTVIANLINRHPEDVRDRVRNYVVCGKNRKTDTWDYDEEQKLIVIMNEAFERIHELRAEPGPDQADMLRKRMEDLVDWSLVSEQMNNTRSRLQCRTKWKSLSASMNGGNIDGEVGRSMDEIIEKARDEADSMSHRDRYHIAKAVSKCGATADSRIPWAKLRSSRVGQKWSRPTLMLVWYRLRHSIPHSAPMSIPELAGQICSSFQENGAVNFQDEEDMDLDAEYRDVEYKIGKILNHNRPKPKTPWRAIKSDDSEVVPVKEQDEDEDEDEEGEKDEVEEIEDDQEGQAEEPDPADWDMSSLRDLATRDNPRGASIDLGLDQSPMSDDREIDESVLDSPKIVKTKRNTSSAKGNKRRDRAAAASPKKKKAKGKIEEVEEEAASDPFEPSDLSPQRFKKAGLKQRGSKASSSATTPANTRKGKGRTTKQPVSDEDKSASSNTDAEDAEDIPARI
jgi:hypothetical protein